LLLAVAVLVWHDFSRGQASVQTLTTEQSGVSKVVDQSASELKVVVKTPIASRPEVDQKLKALGFGNSAEVHRIIVSK